MSKDKRDRRAIVRRDQMLQIERRRPGTGRPAMFPVEHEDEDEASKEALRPPPVVVNGRRIDA